MKKLLVVFFVLIMTHCSANATTCVQYNRAGAMVTVSRGAGMPRSVHSVDAHRDYYARRFANGHYATPMRKVRATVHPRKMAMTRNERIMNQAMPQVTAPAAKVKPIEVSRFSKNYTVPIRKLNTRNGVIYYN